jgi:hypothetical protein
MENQVEREQLKSGLILPWLVACITVVMLAVYIIVCHTLGQLQEPLPEAQRVIVRTVFYTIAIVIFPLTNLIRHIQLRLNQTMPYFDASHPNKDCMEPLPTTTGMKQSSVPRLTDGAIAKARNRYFVTITVSMALVGVVGIFGLIMYLMGDGFNTLYLFSGLSALGVFLYRPKADEYIEIIEAIVAQKHE